jgi:uncharacterized protein YpmS
MKRKWIIALALLTIAAFLLISALVVSWREAAPPENRPEATDQR